MRKNRISQHRIRQAREHRRLNSGHDLTGLWAYHRKAENPVVMGSDQGFEETLLLAESPGAQNGVGRQFGYPHADALPRCLQLAQSDPRQRRIREQAVRNQAVARGAIPARKVVAEDSEVIERYMSELRMIGAALSYSPDVGAVVLKCSSTFT